jgi:hypothetical protein
MRADDVAGDACAICGASAGKVGRWKLCFAPLNGLASGTPYIAPFKTFAVWNRLSR